MTRVLITGMCGFIGHHLVEHILKNTDWDIVGIDRLSYASNGLDRLRDIDAFDDKRVLMLTADFTKPLKEGIAKEAGEVDYILHLGANSHVDKSIDDALPFVYDNVLGTVQMLEFARTLPNLEKFVYFSTDEVFGPIEVGTSKEGDVHNPSNPYSASKAAAEDFCIAYANTYSLPIIITNTMNVFGERQHPEKFIPLCINKILKGEKISIHSYPDKKKAGSRFYIHARNVADALVWILDNTDEVLDIHDTQAGRFNIVGELEVDNLSLANFIADILVEDLNYEMVDFHTSRPGHDTRYALDGGKLSELGWNVPKTFKVSLTKTVEWFIDNPRWLKW